MFSVITNIYNKKTKAPTLMEFFCYIYIYIYIFGGETGGKETTVET